MIQFYVIKFASDLGQERLLWVVLFSTIGPREVVTGSPVSTMNKTDDHDIYNIVNLFCDYEFLREISH